MVGISRFCLLGLGLAMLTASAPASADTIGTFDVQGAFHQGQTLSGTMDIDLDSGLITGTALTISGVGALEPTVTQNYDMDPYYVTFVDYVQGADPTAFFEPQFASGIDATTLVGFTGGTLASLDTPSPNYLTSVVYGVPGIFELQRGTLALASTSTSSVPEPAVWAMLLGGLGLVGTTMHRSRRVAIRFA